MPSHADGADQRFPCCGMTIGWVGPSASCPSGWLVCDGSAVSRTTYANLFTLLSTTWGAGNGTTTFNLPDYRDKVPMGASGTKALGTSGGSSSYTPAGTVATVSATASSPQVSVSLLGVGTAAAQTHTHPAPAFSGTGATILPPYAAAHVIIKT